MGFGKTNVSGGNNDEKLQAHLSDKGNPHGVTAEQVRAMPLAPVQINDTDNVLNLAPGRYYYEGSSDKQTTEMHLPVIAWHWEITVIAAINAEGATHNYKMILAVNNGCVAYYNFLSWDTWGGWNRIATAGDLANYLPLSGGTMTGALGVNNNLALLSGYTDSASTLAQLQAVKDNLNSALLQLERPLDDKTWPNAALYQRVNGGDYTLIGRIIHTGNIENYAAKIVAGTYTGDGNASMSITLPFTPKAVYVCPSHGGTLWIPEGSGNGTTYTYGGLAVTGQNAVTWRGGHDVVAIQTGGFTAYYAHYSNEFMYAAANMEGQKYNYIAFG